MTQDAIEAMLYVCGTIVLLGIVSCEVLDTRQKAATERLAIEKGWCRETSYGQWKPCPPPPDAEKGK